jgi:hypothetical protein
MSDTASTTVSAKVDPAVLTALADAAKANALAAVKQTAGAIDAALKAVLDSHAATTLPAGLTTEANAAVEAAHAAALEAIRAVQTQAASTMTRAQAGVQGIVAQVEGDVRGFITQAGGEVRMMTAYERGLANRAVSGVAGSAPHLEQIAASEYDQMKANLIATKVELDTFRAKAGNMVHYGWLIGFTLAALAAGAAFALHFGK